MMDTKYSVVLHKATRKPKIVLKGQALDAAVKRASGLYEDSLLFAQHKSLHSGVAVFVLSDEVAARLEATNDFGLLKSSMYQCGSW